MATTDELIAAVNAGDAGLVARLVGEDPSLAMARDPAGVSVLMLARYRFDRAVTEALLAADPALDVFEAASLGHADRLHEAIDHDPDVVTAYSADGFTALHFAAFFGKAESARILLDSGAPVDSYTRNTFANQPLHAAAAGRHVEVCRLLLAAGANVDGTQHGGYRPLHQAAQHGDAEMVELFLSAGADPAAKVDDGGTAADIAANAGHPDVVARLRTITSGGAEDG